MVLTESIVGVARKCCIPYAGPHNGDEKSAPHCATGPVKSRLFGVCFHNLGHHNDLAPGGDTEWHGDVPGTGNNSPERSPTLPEQQKKKEN